MVIMEKFYTVKYRKIHEIDVEKSKFIGILQGFSKNDDLKSILDGIRKEFPKARHYCYAYTLDGEFKYSDDGEPSGTAGKPMYAILENHNLKNVLLVIVRYFGGTLLGSGRLLRTYSTCAKETVESSKLYEISKKQKIRVSVSEDSYNTLISFLNKHAFTLLNTYFNDKIILDFLTDVDYMEDISSIFYGKVEIIGKTIVDYMEERND